MENLELRNKTIFISGGGGFIGSTLAERLIDDNQVVIYDNFRRNSLKQKSFLDHPNLSVVEGDILELQKLTDAVQGADIVVHCAAIAGIDTVIKKPTETMRVNMLGTANMLKAAQTLTQLQRFVDFSTSEVFGQSAFRVDETQTTHIGVVGEARWTYAVSKLAAEHLTKAYHVEFGMPTVTVRPFNIYGPGQVGEGAIKIFIDKAIKDEELVIHGDGNQIRAWCFIEDFIRGLMLAMTEERAVGESFNIGNAKAVITIYGLAQTIVRVLDSKSVIRFENKDYVDVELRVPAIRKAKDLLGFESAVDLEEGIQKTADYFRSQMND